MEQNVAYGDIMIAPGPRFEEHLEVEDCFESVIPIPMAFPSDESIVALSSPIVVSSSLVASNESIIALPLVAARNKGGRINGSTNANKRRGILDKKRAVNWVCHQYHERQAELKDANKSNRKKAKLKAGTREKLVIRAKAMIWSSATCKLTQTSLVSSVTTRCLLDATVGQLLEYLLRCSNSMIGVLLHWNKM